MTIPFDYKREDLIAKITAMLPAAKKHDAVVEAKHKKDEAAYLAEFKTACRKALKWTYEEAKTASFEAKVREPNSWGGYERKRSPHCPTSRVEHIQRVLREIDRSPAKRFRITERGAYGSIHALLMIDVPAEKAVC